MNVVAIIQARMGSSRLPGKVLADLCGAPLLERVVRRVSRAASVTQVVIATTTKPADDAIARLCDERGWSCFRGSEDDVLDRYYQAARLHKADVVVRVTSDDPFVDPELIDELTNRIAASPGEFDYACNFLPRRTFPLGLDFEVATFATLERAWREDDNPAWREHVFEYVLHRPELFRIAGIAHNEDLSHLRWTVDTPEDLELARRVYEHFRHDRFSWREAVALMNRHPEWRAINEMVIQRQV